MTDIGLYFRRLAWFLGLAFGLAWLVVYLTGGIMRCPVLVSGTPITLALVLLPTGYMGATAIAHLLTRLIMCKGWHPCSSNPS